MTNASALYNIMDATAPATPAILNTQYYINGGRVVLGAGRMDVRVLHQDNSRPGSTPL